MRILNAAFELAFSLTAFGFFVLNAAELFDPRTHPQWRFFILGSLFGGFVALAFFVGSVRRLRLEGAKKDGPPPKG